MSSNLALYIQSIVEERQILAKDLKSFQKWSMLIQLVQVWIYIMKFV